MKKIILASAFLLLGSFSIYFMTSGDSETPRGPASIPGNYETMKAAEKLDVLWAEIRATSYSKLPEYKKFGIGELLGMSFQELQIKGQKFSDFAPAGWKKYLHRRAAVAKVKIVPVQNKYTGIFQGADSAILRLSLTYMVEGDKPVAPGLALKVLRDGTHSANISALVSLNGQGTDFDFFKNAMSNIVPIGSGLGQNLVHRLFSGVSKYPEELMVEDMASINAQGTKIASVTSPRQLFFVPHPSQHFSSERHDVREDFLRIPSGTVVYQIFAVSDKYSNHDYTKYTSKDLATFIKESQHVADVVTTSEFIASSFGDDGIFFRHQFRYK